MLLRNPSFHDGLGLSVHIRTKIQEWWSYIASVVVQIGEDTLEFTGGKNGDWMYWINGKPGDMDSLEDGSNLHATLSGFPIKYKNVSAKANRFRVDLGVGNALALENYNKFIRVTVGAHTKDKFVGSLGLMGSFPEGKRIARDGETVVKKANDFGKEWQVLADEPQLFHTMEGPQSPMGCTMPDVTKRTKRRLGEALITKDEAAVACAHAKEAEKDACIFDVLATNDKDLAGSH